VTPVVLQLCPPIAPLNKLSYIIN